ncbi:hypothetical protein Gogos_016175 [Gossypium gossypioides]|uniref:Uncharacterized protein n=1 Tax=Gossypium gossypioides TaxID=34282 RepID=A0A7J9B7A8_GOSGO|nr:hypothetical protein [Gossypium gossypioides]
MCSTCELLMRRSVKWCYPMLSIGVSYANCEHCLVTDCVTVGSAYSRPYVPNNLSYAGYEGNSNGGGYHRFRRAYTARQAHY